MSITTLTSLELNQDVGQARKAALQGPVLITDGGRPAHVLLSFQEYQRLTGNRASIADLLAMPGAEEVELEVHPLRDFPKSASFS
jgi:PHD/YefM family antitoxin component YafN of YafNO toxin-antitoxin module